MKIKFRGVAVRLNMGSDLHSERCYIVHAAKNPMVARTLGPI